MCTKFFIEHSTICDSKIYLIGLGFMYIWRVKLTHPIKIYTKCSFTLKMVSPRQHITLTECSSHNACPWCNSVGKRVLSLVTMALVQIHCFHSAHIDCLKTFWSNVHLGYCKLDWFRRSTFTVKIDGHAAHTTILIHHIMLCFQWFYLPVCLHQYAYISGSFKDNRNSW